MAYYLLNPVARDASGEYETALALAAERASSTGSCRSSWRPGLLLQRFTDDDVEKLVALDGDPAVMRFINGAGRARATRSRRS